MMGPSEVADGDWKQRCEQLQFKHQLDLERIRLCYDHELREKVTEIRSELKREYDQHFSEFRTRLLEQQQQQQLVHNTSSHSVDLDQTIGEQVREQVRIAQENDRYEAEQLVSLPTGDTVHVERLINHLHTEGVQVLTLSELLSLQINGSKSGNKVDSMDSAQKLLEENGFLRSLVGHMGSNATSSTLIQCLADIFRCEQERRLIQVREQTNSKQLEADIDHMCHYQRNALEKVLSHDRQLLIDELEQTREELGQLKTQLDQLKRNHHESTIVNPSNLNRFYAKYLRGEAHRKALIYQKRYLLVLLTGYQDTETYALEEIRRLTGASKWKVSHDSWAPHPTRSISRKHSRQRAFNYRFRFRSAVRVVIAILRLRWLAKKWTRKMASLL